MANINRILITFWSIIGLLRTTQAANCFEKVADIVFLLDSSSSILTEDFNRQLKFVQNVADNFEIGDNNIQVGVITFSDSYNLNFHLNEHRSKAELKSAIWRIPYLGGGTNPAEAIRYVREEMFKPEHGGRPWASQILMIITDGFSNSIPRYQQAHEEAYFAKYLNITIMAIGVGNGVRERELEGLASTPKEKYVYRVDDFGALSTIRDELSIKSCEESQSDQSPPQALEHEKQASKFCGGKPADVYFLLDSSSSIHFPDYQRQLTFVTEVVDIFDISEGHTRIGVSLYSDGIHPVIPLKNYFNKEDLKYHISHLRRLTGNTNTGAALKYLREYGFRDDIARREVAHIVILLTDGNSTDPRTTKLEARLAKEAGIYLFAIGIGSKASTQELMTIASDPDENFMFRVDNYDALHHIRNILAIKACNVEATPNDNDAHNHIACGNGPRDIMFVFDSNSLGLKKSTIIRKTIGKITKVMGLESRQDQKVGIMTEVHPHGTNSRLSKIQDQVLFEEKLDGAKDGKLKSLLKKLRHHSFLPINGGRPYAEHTAVIFVDNTSHITPAIIREASLTSSKVKLYVVVIGDEGSVLGADQIYSSPSGIYPLHVPSYEEMASSATSIAKALCRL